ncbi:MAG: hypothetical protein JWO89_3594 [Verrucomicrobiaceae bacterium]|nr:hypothetical protein [Verrucomicrobiaceae bacterium]MDB6118018.1 hypothetical protein [Verrucomicrobiaceae bacterium]
MSQSPDSFKSVARDMSKEAIAKHVCIMDHPWKAAQKTRPLQVNQQHQQPSVAILA